MLHAARRGPSLGPQGLCCSPLTSLLPKKTCTCGISLCLCVCERSLEGPLGAAPTLRVSVPGRRGFHELSRGTRAPSLPRTRNQGHVGGTGFTPRPVPDRGHRVRMRRDVGISRPTSLLTVCIVESLRCHAPGSVFSSCFLPAPGDLRSQHEPCWGPRSFPETCARGGGDAPRAGTAAPLSRRGGTGGHRTHPSLRPPSRWVTGLGAWSSPRLCHPSHGRSLCLSPHPLPFTAAISPRVWGFREAESALRVNSEELMIQFVTVFKNGMWFNLLCCIECAYGVTESVRF